MRSRSCGGRKGCGPGDGWGRVRRVQPNAPNYARRDNRIRQGWRVSYTPATRRRDQIPPFFLRLQADSALPSAAVSIVLLRRSRLWVLALSRWTMKRTAHRKDPACDRRWLSGKSRRQGHSSSDQGNRLHSFTCMLEPKFSRGAPQHQGDKFSDANNPSLESERALTRGVHFPSLLASRKKTGRTRWA